MNVADEFARAEVVRIAKSILQGEVRPLLGARLLSRYARQFKEDIGFDAWAFIVGVDSETDGMPIGPERIHWAPEALREKDRRADDYEQRVKDDLLQVARKLMTQFSKP